MDQASRPTQQPSASRSLRCAVYTRTSREGVESAFDSIDAQRDACLAYIASQRTQGWLAPPSSLDDPGVSGATLKRPSLARMLAAIESGLVDVVVVYKIDRLSRSLADFSSLMQLFDRHGVGLVSVTQHLNSLDAAGRLGINTLMAFAQFERENAAERTRDKLRATRRQGLWAGGVPPMGYKVVNQRLQVLPDEAAVVRRIFERFVALGSITELVSELNEQGVTTKLLISQAGRSRGGQRFDKSYLYKVIKNRTLTGEIKSGQTWYPGQHLPIVSAELWAQAQALLSLRRRARKTGIDKPQALMLKGLVFGTDGRAYSPCRSSLQNGRSYSYYIPQRKIAEGARATDLPTCPAGELETVVVEHVRKTLRNPGTLLDALPAAIKQHPGYSNDAATAALASIDGIWDELFYLGRPTAHLSSTWRFVRADVSCPGNQARTYSLLIPVGVTLTRKCPELLTIVPVS